MSHTVEIPDDLFSRLQQWAEPLVDNTVSLIAKLADYYEAGHSPAPPCLIAIWRPTVRTRTRPASCSAIFWYGGSKPGGPETISGRRSPQRPPIATSWSKWSSEFYA